MKKSKESWQGNNKKGIRELRAALGSANSADENLKIFKKIEARLEEKQLGSDCWIMAMEYGKEGQQDPEKVLSFGKRALDIMLHDETNAVLGIHRSSMAIGSVLHLLGSACFDLKRYNESLSYLNWSDRNLSKLLEDNYCDNFVLQSLHNTHLELGKVKKAIGKVEEVVFHSKKVLEIGEKIMESGCVELGSANNNVSNAYREVGNFKDALPFALKALEICKKHMADDSREVTELRLSLVVIYLELGECEKAFEQNQSSFSGLKIMGDTFRLLMAEVGGGKMLVHLGRYEEAIEAMKLVISQAEIVVDQRGETDTTKYHGVRAAAFTVIAKAFCKQEKFANARKNIKMVVRIYEKQRIDLSVIATGLLNLAELYEEMKEYEAVISLVQKALNIPELPQGLLANAHVELRRLQKVMGRGEEAVYHSKKVLEIEEKIKKEGCIELGKANKDVSDAYEEVGNYKEALPFALKALEIYREHLSEESEEITKLRMSIGMIYSELGEHDKASEQNGLCLSGVKSMGNKHLIMAELARGDMLVDLGRYEEAIETLKPVISQSETTGNQVDRALASMVLAKAFCKQEKFSDARKYMKIALRFLKKKSLAPSAIAIGFMEMAKLHEEMKEYEASISLLQKALNIPELPTDYFADSSFRLFSLVSLTGRQKKSLSFLKVVVEKLKEKFGREHSHVGYGYENLGLVYMNLGKSEMAVELIVRAKEILDVSLGPHHPASLNAAVSLSLAYAGMESYDLAIENQEKVVEGFKGLGLSEQVSLDNAVQMLNMLNMLKGESIGEVADSHTSASHQFEDGEDLSDADSECGVSDDGKVI